MTTAGQIVKWKMTITIEDRNSPESISQTYSLSYDKIKKFRRNKLFKDTKVRVSITEVNR